MTTEQEALQVAREKFLSERTKQEMQVANWASKVNTVKENNPELFDSISLPEPLTLQSLIPELYVDSPNQEIYLQQYAEATTLIGQVNDIASKLNEEAIKCLQEYKELSSK